jgi:hypothetical protein
MILFTYFISHRYNLAEMNIFLKSLLVVMVSLAVVKAVPVPDDGPPSNWEQKDFWTHCLPHYTLPYGACKQYGFSVTTNPDEGFTKARQVDRWWNGGVNKCSDAPARVRYFCSKIYTKAYWQGTFYVLVFYC